MGTQLQMSALNVSITPFTIDPITKEGFIMADTGGAGNEVLINLALTSRTTMTMETMTEDEFRDRVIEAVVLSLICAMALLGNTSLWLVVCRDRKLRTTSNCLILCLSAADLLVSAINMPVTVVTIVYGHWPLSQTACVALGFITMITFIGSVMSLGVISINRFILICYPINFKLVYTPGRTALMIIGTWALSICLASPPLFGWGEYDYLPGQSFCFCNWKTSISYTIFMVAACFGGPVTIMTICYVGILRKVRESRRRIQSGMYDQERRSSIASNRSHRGGRHKMAAAAAEQEHEAKFIHAKNNEIPDRMFRSNNTNDIIDSSSSMNRMGNYHKSTTPGAHQPQSQSLPPSATRRRPVRRGQPEDLRLTATLLVVISIFIICWLPFCITMFLSVFSPYPVPRAADIATLLLGCFNSMCNPIIYGIMNKRFWEGYKRLYCCLCRKVKGASNQRSRSETSPSDELENTGNQSWRDISR